MPPGRGARMSGSGGEDRLGKIQEISDMHRRGGRGSSQREEEDRLGRIHSGGMLLGGNIISREKTSLSTATLVSTFSTFTHSSLGSQQQQQPRSTHPAPLTAPQTKQELMSSREEGSLFKRGGGRDDTETVSTAATGFSSVFSSVSATADAHNKASIVVDSLFSEEDKVAENKLSTTIDALFSSSAVAETDENTLEKPVAAVQKTLSSTETGETACLNSNNSSAIIMGMGTPLPGLSSSSSSTTAPSTAQQQQHPPVHMPNSPPGFSSSASAPPAAQQQESLPVHLLGGIFVGGEDHSTKSNVPAHVSGGGGGGASSSSVYTGVSSLGGLGTVSASMLDAPTISSLGTGMYPSFGVATDASSFRADTDSSFGTRTASSAVTGTIPSFGTRTASTLGTGSITTERDLPTSIFGRGPAGFAPVPDDSGERATALAAEQAMFKKTGVPKAAVHCWYGQKPRRQIISQENYVTWHDNGPPHVMHYTSLFICPMSGEAFGSGRYGDAKHYKTDAHDPNIVWYKRKALAEHGAAARAFDCLVFREAQAAGGATSSPGSTMAEFRIGKDEPYLAATAAVPKGSSLAAFLAVPSHVPSSLRPEVEKIIRQGQANMAHDAPAPATTKNQGNDDDDDMDVEEAAWKKNSFVLQNDHELQQRCSQPYDDQAMQQTMESFMHPTIGNASNIFDDPDEP